MSLLYGAQKKKKGDAESASFIFVHTALGGWQVKKDCNSYNKNEGEQTNKKWWQEEIQNYHEVEI